MNPRGTIFTIGITTEERETCIQLLFMLVHGRASASREGCQGQDTRCPRTWRNPMSRASSPTSCSCWGKMAACFSTTAMLEMPAASTACCGGRGKRGTQGVHSSVYLVSKWRRRSSSKINKREGCCCQSCHSLPLRNS